MARALGRSAGFFRSVVCFVVVTQAAPALAEQRALFEGSSDGKEWVELPVSLPPFPEDRNLVRFAVSPAATAGFLIDATSITYGSDDIWRFALVIRTAGGAENVSYEGIRCATYERRLYATGRRGQGWVSSRNDAWLPISENTLNRYHAALAKEYFCPPGAAIPGLTEVVDSLRRGARFQ